MSSVDCRLKTANSPTSSWNRRTAMAALALARIHATTAVVSASEKTQWMVLWLTWVETRANGEAQAPIRDPCSEPAVMGARRNAELVFSWCRLPRSACEKDVDLDPADLHCSVDP